MRRRAISGEMIPLSPPAYHVLLALGSSVLHGYGIMEAFETMTDGAESLLPGTLYTTLARMVETGMVEESEPPTEERSGGPQRRYYHVTDLGREVARAESLRMTRLLALAERQDLSVARS